MPQSDSVSTVLPIENSPPGIQTIPSGAGCNAFAPFAIVGLKADPSRVSTPALLPGANPNRETSPDLNTAKTLTAATAMIPTITQRDEGDRSSFERLRACAFFETRL